MKRSRHSISNKKRMLFSLVLLGIVLISFESILALGGYVYSDIHSRFDNVEIEEGEFRILFLGESTTVGAPLGKTKAYPIKVEGLLQKKYPDQRIRSYNKAVGGCETTAILRNLDRNMIKYKPHLVIIMAGQNDNAVQDENMSLVKRMYSKLRVYRLVTSFIDVPLLHQDVRDSEDKDFLYFSMDNGQTYKYKPINPLSQVIYNLEFIVHKIHSYNSEIWFLGYLQPDAREKINPILGRIAEKEGIVYIGNYPAVDFEANHSLFSNDGWHPSEEGYNLIAEYIAKKVIENQVIEKWQSQDRGF